jgi:tagatose 1,6-diphosphate aldolase
MASFSGGAMMSNLSIGKIRGLQQCANNDGTFSICAMDHRGSFTSMIDAKNLDGVSSEEVVQRKQELCSHLSKHASAMLLDPIYSAAQCIIKGTLPGGKGLLVSIEETGYEGGKENRVTQLLADWSVEKIKRMGASAVKLLIYYRPDLKAGAEKQLAIVSAVANDCLKYDIPFFVEPVSYPIGSEVNNHAEYARRKGELVIETAKQMTALPIDILKAEFPADMKFNNDKSQLLKLCRELDKASRVPWVLLSAGVDFETFSKQVEFACQAGASGFMGGRAIWQEAMGIPDTAKRTEYLSTTVGARMTKLNAIVAANGRPWYKKWGTSLTEMARITEDWYRQY